MCVVHAHVCGSGGVRMHICVYQCTDVLGCRSNVNDKFFLILLAGRPEKLPDVCYSWWVLASLKIIGRIHWISKVC